MKPWIQRSLIGLFGAGIVLGGIGACSHRAWHHHGMDGEQASAYAEKMIERVSRELSLDAAQRQRLVALGDAMRAQRQALVGSTTDARGTLQALVSGSQFDRGRALALLDEKTGAIRAQGPAVVAAAADFFDSLNPQQQQQLRDRLQKGHRWFGRG